MNNKFNKMTIRELMNTASNIEALDTATLDLTNKEQLNALKENADLYDTLVRKVMIPEMNNIYETVPMPIIDKEFSETFGDIDITKTVLGLITYMMKTGGTFAQALLALEDNRLYEITSVSTGFADLYNYTMNKPIYKLRTNMYSMINIGDVESVIISEIETCVDDFIMIAEFNDTNPEHEKITGTDWDFIDNLVYKIGQVYPELENKCNEKLSPIHIAFNDSDIAEMLGK